MKTIAIYFLFLLSVIYVETFTAHPRLSVIADAHEYYHEEPHGPGTYSFGFDIEDTDTGNIQFRSEEKLSNGSVTGSYGYVTPEGSIHMVHYIADQLGYRARIEDASLTTLRDNYHNSDPSTYSGISPRMLHALTSLKHFNPHQVKEEQHVRPIDRVPVPQNENRFISDENRHRTQDTRHRNDESRYRGDENRYRGDENRYRSDENRYRSQENRYRSQENRHRPQENRRQDYRNNYNNNNPRSYNYNSYYVPGYTRYYNGY